MLAHLRPAIATVVLFTGICGLAYPLAITGIATATMPAQAQGSLARNGETVVGSTLIGQTFTADKYFWPRPSATSPNGYNAMASGGSNLAATSQKLHDQIAANIDAWKKAGGSGAVPADAVTASGSGLDPDITPENALSQIARVAKARGLAEADVAKVVDANVERRLFGVIGEAHVNVLKLNMALDSVQ